MVSGTISLFCSKCFSPFPHGTGPLSVSREYLALPDGPGRFTQNSSCSALLRIPLCFVSLRVRVCHLLWTHFPEGSTHEISCNGAVLQPHMRRNAGGLGSSPFARHYWGNHCLFSLPAGTKMFQFPALASRLSGMVSLQDIGLSHSEIRGSRVICTSPQLIAAYHVLRRLREPRHPPCALSCFFSPRRPAPCGARRHILSALTLLFLFHHVIDRCPIENGEWKIENFRTPVQRTVWRITDSNR